MVWYLTSAHLQAYEPEQLLDSSNIRKLIKVGTDVTAIATDAVTILQYALVRVLSLHARNPLLGSLVDVFCLAIICEQAAFCSLPHGCMQRSRT